MNFMQKKIFWGVILLMNSLLLADEGMWTLDNLPLEKIQKEYNFLPSAQLLKKIQLASVRFNDGGSGSFVSKSGLILTNHHVAIGQLQKLSSKKRDLVKYGFYAKTQKEEIPCPDLEINILVNTREVTSEIQKEIEGLTNFEEIKSKKDKVIAEIEKSSFEKTGLRSNVITLYEGGQYWLYIYKKLTDIRLVFAPELALASFGGDPDNFQYPRYALDFAFFRAYENGKPYKPKEFFHWNSQGLKSGEISFVSGHPGSTDRHKTVAQLAYYRDYAFVESLKIIKTKLQAAREFSKLGKEEKRIAQEFILHLENSLKAMQGEHLGLKSKEVFEQIEQREKKLIELYKSKPELELEYGNPWKKIEAIQDLLKERYKQIYYRRLGGKLAKFALGIVRYAHEIEKPNEKRYAEFRDSSLDSWKHSLLSSAPIYKNFEQLQLKLSLEMAKKELGLEDKFVQKSISKKEIEVLVKELISKTKLDDFKFRKKLIEGGRQVIEQSQDPLLVWMREVEPILREDRDWYEKEVETPLDLEGGKIARLKFLLFGKLQYPDATFTLRLSYGKKLSYEIDGWKVPEFTTFYGLFERSKAFGNKFPYEISLQLQKNQKKVDLEKSINFVTTHDITGGNSGSPVIDKQGQIVGLIFDGNAYSHVLNYFYTDEKARAISVSTEGIEETLKSIYRAKRILKEIQTGE